MQQQLYYLHALSALHVGIGEGSGVIDLPIAREKATLLPLVPGSAVKGVLRDHARNAHAHQSGAMDDLLALFGPEPGENASEYAGALAVGDSHLLCLPVRSWLGTFAWATCPMILRRYRRDLDTQIEIPVSLANTAITAKKTVLADQGKLYLEDLDIVQDESQSAEAWAAHFANTLFPQQPDWQNLFQERLVILPDDIFDFLSETATEIRARIRIQEGTRTVQPGALWYEEYLPAETILWGLLAVDRPRKSGCVKNRQQLLAVLLPENGKRLQIGGNASVGGGQVRWLTDFTDGV
ncbi:MAG: type III-B CRISPR module RAMP protein Cmr4 [Methylobacter sp.]|nr:MAG: type III-B CRISPR module RAMP protein Cmr4 [Methylobacter sp.]PPD18699.1 MAG: type III-B CRISPR module RAMP protein Cmr4 [Methylobacter sp.]PPD32295.1 MAG: type III-B CRISPR module RAMP protein Cmr4 [Methylomonas sp.]